MKLKPIKNLRKVIQNMYLFGIFHEYAISKIKN